MLTSDTLLEECSLLQAQAGHTGNKFFRHILNGEGYVRVSPFRVSGQKEFSAGAAKVIAALRVKADGLAAKRLDQGAQSRCVGMV